MAPQGRFEHPFPTSQVGVLIPYRRLLFILFADNVERYSHFFTNTFKELEAKLVVRKGLEPFFWINTIT